MSRAVEICAICCEIHWGVRASWHPDAKPLCLDCHGPLDQLDPYIFRCGLCYVKHGFQGGFGGSGHYYRAGQLVNVRNGISIDYKGKCVLSKHAPFLRWLHARNSGSGGDAPANVTRTRNRLAGRE